MATSTAYFSGIRQVILDHLDTATTEIKVAVAWFTNRQLFAKLCEKRKSGVNVSIVVIDDFINNGDWGLNFQEFINLGGKLYYGKADNPMHHKFCIIDDHTLINGSYNWTYYAESRNIENIVLFQNQSTLVQQFNDEFERLFQNLDESTVAIKRPREELSLYDMFSIRNYLSYDLYQHGKETGNLEFYSAATRLVPENTFLETQYQEISKRKIIKKTTVALGIKSRENGVDGRFSKLINKLRNVPIIGNSGNYTTTEDNQDKLSVEIFKGENDDCAYNQMIDQFSIDIPPKLAGQASVTVTFSLDEKGSLTVKAKCNDTGNEKSVTYQVADLVF